MKSLVETVASNIIKFRKAGGMSQEQLAEKLSVNFMTVGNWERGTAWVKPEIISKLAEIFGIDEIDLFLPFQMPADVRELILKKNLDKHGWDRIRIALGVKPKHLHELIEQYNVLKAQIESSQALKSLSKKSTEDDRK